MIALAAAAVVPGVTGVVLWEPPLGPELGTDAAELAERLRAAVGRGDAEAVLATFMEGMPPEWFDAVRSSPQWPSYAAMAPTVVADTEARAWTRARPRAELFAGIAASCTVLLGTDTFAFSAAAADSWCPRCRARRATVVGAAHGWEPADLAEAIAHALRRTPGRSTEHGAPACRRERRARSPR